MRTVPATLDAGGVLRDAWELAKEDRAVLSGVAGLLLFVPQLALLLFPIDLPVAPAWGADPAVTQAYADVAQAWLARHALPLLAVLVLTEAAPIAITLLYVDRRRLDVAGALLATPSLFFPALLARLVASPIALSLYAAPLLVLLAAYLQGRLLLVLPALLAERPLSVLGAVRRSWSLTRGHGLAMAGLACIVVLAGLVVSTPVRWLGLVFGGAPLANPVVALVLHGASALVLVAGIVFGLLIQVAAYRRLIRGT